MPWMRLGDRDDLEKSIRLLLFLPGMFLGGPIASVVLKDSVPIGMAFVIGGAVGGGIGGLLAQGLIWLLRLLWPPKRPKRKRAVAAQRKTRR